MALIVGQAHTDPVTGMAGRIYTALISAADPNFAAGVGTVGNAARNSLAIMCEAIAAGVIDEFHANGTSKVGAAIGGLQRDNTGGNPLTLASGADTFLPIV